MNNCLSSVIRSSLLLLLVAIGTAGCATGGLQATTPEQRAEQLAGRGSHGDAASAYIGLATSATGSERDRLTLLAIEQWLEAGDGRRARNALRRMPAPPSGELLWLWSSNAAALALFEGRPDDAQRILEPLSRQALPMAYRLRVEALLADSWFQLGDPIRALSLYRQRETWLDTSQEVARNQQRIWAGLLASNPAQLRSAADETMDPELKGWLTLGALAASTGRQGIGWANGVNRWQQTNPDHPAMALLQGMELPAPGEVEYPLQIALLLPLSGDNASAGMAVQNGFFGAYFSTASELDNAQQVAVYDTGGNGGASRAYAEAIANGAEFVVGPLLRDSVVAVANEGMLPIPVLALNYLPDEIPAPPGLYQFALSPEDEAASAARRAIADGHRRALALVPNNDWGTRLLQSFAREFEAAGGTLLEAQDYQSSSQDFSYEIESLMLLTQSVQRYQRLRANIGGPLQFDPRRREDAEFIFLAATAPAARLLKSQLKFHYAGDLPVYSTSRIHSMDGRSNADLNGVMFADTPWVIAPHTWIANLPDLYAEYWPAERRMGRLHALGYDAYNLVAALFASRFDDMAEIDGATGVLYLDADGRVHRQLAWARFQGGEPVAMPDNTPDRRDSRYGEDLPGERTDTDRDSTWLEPIRRQ